MPVNTKAGKPAKSKRNLEQEVADAQQTENAAKALTQLARILHSAKRVPAAKGSRKSIRAPWRKTPAVVQGTIVGFGTKNKQIEGIDYDDL